ncbi:hypothetical protein V474_13475 [Novosphingobium barchaimii LL02]|uniref:Uncharacterized protein n=1 Tax=Novosphingobium barchaimii LL02 TaxID=1114963 RepID=A0A0J7XYN7_9SPHN|nr:hypothetical protein V474_13475 [Novosphingobium barchaimii LL02]
MLHISGEDTNQLHEMEMAILATPCLSLNRAICDCIMGLLAVIM